jgi:hypothetical protein
MGTAMMWAWVNPVLRPTEHRTQGLNASIEYEFSVFFSSQTSAQLAFRSALWCIKRVYGKGGTIWNNKILKTGII